jgi:transcriptional regulator GlxA family with amidase domain
MNDYERIARVIRYLDENHADQPDLATIARYVGLSRYHLHRLFTSWAGGFGLQQQGGASRLREAGVDENSIAGRI